MSEHLDKPLPSNDDAERIVITEIFYNNMLLPLVKKIVGAEQFYSPIHRNVIKFCLELDQKGLPLNPVNVLEEAKAAGFTFPNGIATFNTISHGLPRFGEEDVIQYATLIKHKAIVRDLIKECNLTVANALAEDASTKELVEGHNTRLHKVTTDLYDETFVKPGFVSLADMEPEAMEHFANLHEGKAGGLPTGIPELDDKLDGNGLQRKGAYYFGALPKLGKTSLALRIAKNCVKNQNRTALVASAEMHRLSLMKRLYSPEIGVPYSKFRPGLDGADFQKVVNELHAFTRQKLKISDSIFTIPDLWRYAREEVLQGKRMADKTGDESWLVGLLVVDYLQLFSFGAQMNIGKKVEEVTAISREIKMLANALDIPVIGITSLNSGPMTEKRKPEIGDAGWSKSIIYDAEAIWFLHSENFLDPDYEPLETEDVLFMMPIQRNGPRAVQFNMKFYGEFMEFLTEQEFAELQMFTSTRDKHEHEQTNEGLFSMSNTAEDKELDSFFKV